MPSDFRSDALDFSQALHSRIPEPFDATEMVEQGLPSRFAQTRKIVQNGLPDPLASEFGVKLVGKTMSLVSDLLQETKSRIAFCEFQFPSVIRKNDGFLFLCQSDQGWRFATD